jgi:hypothetical protein
MAIKNNEMQITVYIFLKMLKHLSSIFCKYFYLFAVNKTPTKVNTINLQIKFYSFKICRSNKMLMIRVFLALKLFALREQLAYLIGT